MSDCNDCASATMTPSTPVIKRVLWVALIANALMFVVEMLASWWGQSMALQADALDFFGDSVNYAISLFVLGSALQVRAGAALFKGLSMALFGLWIIISAIERALTGSMPQPLTMGAVAVLALLVNVAVALMLYRFRSGDSNLRSIWLCSRNDAIGNVAVMFAATGVFALQSRWPDLLVATLIASLSLHAAVQVSRQAMQEIKTASWVAS